MEKKEKNFPELPLSIYETGIFAGQIICGVGHSKEDTIGLIIKVMTPHLRKCDKIMGPIRILSCGNAEIFEKYRKRGEIVNVSNLNITCQNLLQTKGFTLYDNVTNFALRFGINDQFEVIDTKDKSRKGKVKSILKYPDDNTKSRCAYYEIEYLDGNSSKGEKLDKSMKYI